MVWLRWHCWVGFFGHRELVEEEQRQVETWPWVLEGSHQQHLAWDIVDDVDALEAFQSQGHLAVASCLVGTSLEQHQKASFVVAYEVGTA